ncbi:tRNA lysidine(34) synthetase TilS [Acidiphilium acidophilum]|uniref:tRNA(Ile)-lysidine synthase n=1 Tax=Acidiphilium acidophilum TaxID=76588 RepID=A0AAW9DS40_ACIAO|nr:tRNA lysidine(34) synthetase TilS [Acidiphilium acidophilum]MDX5931441.1 tRNA lysidine(34) synthetase TilS [Acidiphilium acidophilum]
MTTGIAARFAAAMDDLLGAAVPAPRLAVALSGGADSSCLAVLSHEWAVARGGSVVALIADHGLRAGSAAEAALTARRMAGLGIAAEIVTLDIPSGAALQERARDARHKALADRAAGQGAIWLLFGHHAGDQAELRAMRARRGPGGAVGMARFAGRHGVVLVRPLLGEDPATLRDELRRRGIGWVEDPSNADPRFERARIRAAGIEITGAGDRPTGAAGVWQDEEDGAAGFLARHARLHPAGYATLTAGAVPRAVLAALIRVIGGAVYNAHSDSVARLARDLRPATLGGVRIMRWARRECWLLCREPASCAPPVAAVAGAVWDRRFRIRAVPAGARTIGALGEAAVAFRSRTGLPGAVLRGLPAFFDGGRVVAVPYCDRGPSAFLMFHPPGPAAPLRWHDADGEVGSGARGVAGGARG